MKIYLCARYSRREEMRGYADLLQAAGHVVTSRWINGSHDLSDAATDLDRSKLAREDYSDLSSADCVISFTEHPGAPGRQRGGRHVEFGLALEQRKLLVIVGPRENVFHYLLDISHCDTFAEALKSLPEVPSSPDA